MKRAAAIAAFGFSLAGCSGMPEMPSLSLSGFGSPAATTIQFESEPAGAEARTSTGQTCRTPCAQAVAASEFTVTFTLNGYQTQTVPVRISSSEAIDPNTGSAPPPRMVPNPVFAELQPVAAAPPPRRRTTPPKPRPQPVAQQQQPQQQQARPAAPPPPPAAQAPAPAPAAAWPPPPPPSR